MKIYSGKSYYFSFITLPTCIFNKTYWNFSTLILSYYFNCSFYLGFGPYSLDYI